jgi:hypothetical protein
MHALHHLEGAKLVCYLSRNLLECSNHFQDGRSLSSSQIVYLTTWTSYITTKH